MNNNVENEIDVDSRKINKISTDIYKELKCKKNTLYSVLILLFSVCIITVTYLWINSSEKSIPFVEIFDSANSQYFALMFICAGLMVLISAFAKFIGLYGINRQKKFGIIFQITLKWHL